MAQGIPIFAHRGASAQALENTLVAFEKARVLGADGIELDIQCTKDDILVVFHDLDLFRLTGKKKRINELTFSELSTYPLGKNLLRRFSKNRIPTFQEVVEWANVHQMPLNIELKESLVDNMKPIIDVLQRLQIPSGSHFSSFHDSLIRIVKMQRPDVETAFIVTKKFKWETMEASTHFDAIHANKSYYKSQNLDVCQNAQKGIRFYNINGSESFLSNPHPAVIGWITDFPDRLAKTTKKIK
ncbi:MULTISPECIES: glycerophosphodiester phosphodiesterase family protein [Lysinibacillus]|uniref:Glycerophosphodiester phosphodiesterase n=1 Tax=Lysinibacillus antri TaxID=2498145 RepID=A0A3S0WIN1_9BACI|nr:MULTISPECIES: glycerophosphodiester phosphodiesterase family protein [Lysinibacillus]RUL56915.1 glycerophosphodiester phosphodiesterase [Lysinibacillus antri]TSI08596.1 glycerophosphodiester phosphodiesterase [Lysinibacillus sp. BW-2-10]